MYVDLGGLRRRLRRRLRCRSLRRIRPQAQDGPDLLEQIHRPLLEKTSDRLRVLADEGLEDVEGDVVAETASTGRLGDGPLEPLALRPALDTESERDDLLLEI